MKILKKNCIYCGKQFEKSYCRSVADFLKRAKYCSKVCMDKYRQGKPTCSPQTTFQKGNDLWKVDTRKKRYGSLNNFWKGGQVNLKCKICKTDFKVKRHQEKTAKTCSRKCYKIFQRTPQQRKKSRKIQKARVKAGLHNMYRGVTAKHMLIRQSAAYKEWRTKVFKRDNYACIFCGKKGYLNADHIKPFSLFPKLRLDVNNGRTLCVECHKTTETYGLNITG